MTAYVVQRLLGACASLCAVAALSFFVLRLTPGGPFDLSQPIPPESLPELNRLFPADTSILEQIEQYFCAIIQGDFGPSLILSSDRSAGRIVIDVVPFSFCLSFSALLLALVLGGLLGAIINHTNATNHTNAPRHKFITFPKLSARTSSTETKLFQIYVSSLAMPTIAGLTVLFAIAPEFVVAPIFAQWITPPVFLPESLSWRDLIQNAPLLALILPMFILGFPHIPSIARLTTDTLCAVQLTPAFLTAQTKGLPHNTLIRRHALPIVLAQIAGRLGPVMAAIITASIAIEPIFDLPGLGMTLQKSLTTRDYTVTTAALLVLCAETLLVDAFGAILQGWLDPRVSAKIHPWPAAVLPGDGCA
ncbi:putative Oligopeptide transporter permease [Azospirillaceae bacterium]